MRTPRSLLMLLTFIRTCGLAGGVAACSSEAPERTHAEASAELADVWCSVKVGCDPRFGDFAECVQIFTYLLSEPGTQSHVDPCEDAMTDMAVCTHSLPDACQEFVRPLTTSIPDSDLR